MQARPGKFWCLYQHTVLFFEVHVHGTSTALYPPAGEGQPYKEVPAENESVVKPIEEASLMNLPRISEGASDCMSIYSMKALRTLYLSFPFRFG